MKAENIKIKRVYLHPLAEDGVRILVDRLWPRNMSKEKAAVVHWFKELAPSTSLRQWFAHDPTKWDQFRQKYLEELKQADLEKIRMIRDLSGLTTVTLVYSAKDEEHNQAVVLREYLDQPQAASRKQITDG